MYTKEQHWQSVTPAAIHGIHAQTWCDTLLNLKELAQVGISVCHEFRRCARCMCVLSAILCALEAQLR